jgi:hypothetical protein
MRSQTNKLDFLLPLLSMATNQKVGSSNPPGRTTYLPTSQDVSSRTGVSVPSTISGLCPELCPPSRSSADKTAIDTRYGHARSQKWRVLAAAKEYQKTGRPAPQSPLAFCVSPAPSATYAIRPSANKVPVPVLGFQALILNVTLAGIRSIPIGAYVADRVP